MDSDAQREAFDLQPGTYCCRFSIDYLPLSPALYVVSVALASGHNYFDFIDSAAVWEVTTGRQDRVSDRGFGGCRIVHAAQLRRVGELSPTLCGEEKQGEVLDQ
jgi:lipopolysaccharide transport system ATP-binding protein